MRRFYFLLFSPLVLWFAACGPTSEPTEQKPLSFKEQTFQDQVGDCTKDNDLCTKMTIQHVIAEGANASKINTVLDTVFVRMADIGEENTKTNKTLQEVAAQFKNSYTEFRKEFPDASPMGWNMDIKTKVLQTQPITSLSILSYSFMGGAHPNTYLRLLNFDAQGNYLEPKKHITDATKFQAALEKNFRKAREIPEGQTWQDAGLFENTLHLPNEMAFTKEGLHVYYNPYEVAAYVYGPTEFTIPYADLEGAMNLDGVK
ncbi:MAG: DUF3298 domain-containing protein [Rhodothermia bacterium]|nr:DUF3298 domain-containing protein [Rhodothermia bacterium]